MFVIDIVWDIDLEDGETYKDARKKLNLPKRVKLPERFLPDNWNAGDLKMGYYDDIADWLSDEYGFCVESFALC